MGIEQTFPEFRRILVLPARSPDPEKQLKRTAHVNRLFTAALAERTEKHSVSSGTNQRNIIINSLDLPAHGLQSTEPVRIWETGRKNSTALNGFQCNKFKFRQHIPPGNNSSRRVYWERIVPANG